MNFRIAVLPGDGIGPEISAVGVDVMTATVALIISDVQILVRRYCHKIYFYIICSVFHTCSSNTYLSSNQTA